MNEPGVVDRVFFDRWFSDLDGLGWAAYGLAQYISTALFLIN
jgi:hypothetical protein